MNGLLADKSANRETSLKVLVIIKVIEKVARSDDTSGGGEVIGFLINIER